MTPRLTFWGEDCRPSIISPRLVGEELTIAQDNKFATDMLAYHCVLEATCRRADSIQCGSVLYTRGQEFVVVRLQIVRVMTSLANVKTTIVIEVGGGEICLHL